MNNHSFKRIHQVMFDVGIFISSWIAAYLIRFESFPTSSSASYVGQMLVFLPAVVLGRLLSFYIFSVYDIIWRYISIRDAMVILKATAPVTIVIAALRFLAPARLFSLRVSISVILIDFLLVLLGTGAVRALRRLVFEDRARDRLTDTSENPVKNVLLIGAGDAGNSVLKELHQRGDLGLYVVGFIDDDREKLKKNIQGVRVLGVTEQIPEIASKYSVSEAIITIANAASKDIRRIVNICREAQLRVKIVPGLFEMFDEKITITKVREVNIDDLLGRSVFRLAEHLPEVTKVYKNKKILVTGAGGSIGSELCRQLAAIGPKEVTLVDKDENGIFEIGNDLNSAFKNGTEFHPVIANINNSNRVRVLFEKYRPQIVFHAAAHKHVPLMELNISEAILNNVLGTINVVEAAAAIGVERFIFISTDKAVYPTSIMGATKKLGEIIVQMCAKRDETRFSCVRFGNVLGSRGSVVPLFKKQIDKGGPVTVTHPEMKRYFMSIAEAVHLIIQAGTLGEKGEIFVLDMGQPIKIVDMVNTLIRLSGHQEDDIEIRYIGIRPGEKLYEEILIEEERTKSTKFEKIFIAPPTKTHEGQVLSGMDALLEAATAGDEPRIIKILTEIGIGFHQESMGD